MPGVPSGAAGGDGSSPRPDGQARCPRVGLGRAAPVLTWRHRGLVPAGPGSPGRAGVRVLLGPAPPAAASAVNKPAVTSSARAGSATESFPGNTGAAGTLGQRGPGGDGDVQ